MSGIIIKDSQVADVSACVGEFVDIYYNSQKKTPPQTPHWKTLPTLAAKKCYIEAIAQKSFVQVVVAIWKEKLTRAALINQSAYLYRYAFNLMAQRVSWFVHENDGWVKFVCSTGKSLKLNHLRREVYTSMYSPRWDFRPVFDPSEIQQNTMGNNRTLCVADACASVYGAALNPVHGRNPSVRPQFADQITDKLYRHDGMLFSYGLKLFPTEQTVIKQMFRRYMFLKSWLKE